MRRMFIAEATVLLVLNSAALLFLVLGRRVVAPLALGTL